MEWNVIFASEPALRVICSQELKHSLKKNRFSFAFTDTFRFCKTDFWTQFYVCCLQIQLCIDKCEITGFRTLFLECSIVQPCRHSPHVATVSFSRGFFVLNEPTKQLFKSIFYITRGDRKDSITTKEEKGTIGLDNAALVSVSQSFSNCI